MLPLGNVAENGRVIERDRQLAAGRSIRSTVYTGKMSSCRFSSRPGLPRTEKIVGRPAKGFTAGVAFGGGGGPVFGTYSSPRHDINTLRQEQDQRAGTCPMVDRKTSSGS